MLDIFKQSGIMSDWDDDGYFGKVVEDYKKVNEHIFEVVARRKRVK